MEFYKVNGLLNIGGYYTIDVLEKMIPWEREIHVGILFEHKNKQQENQS